MKQENKKEWDIKNESKWWGIGLIIAGIIPFIFPELLDRTIGIIALLLGVITLIFRKSWNLVVIGAFIILIGAWNIIATLIDSEQYGFLLLGVIQILIGIGALNQYHKISKKKISNKKTKPTGNSFGIAGLILGILSIVIGLFLAFVGIVMGILGIIFSVKQLKESPNGIATAGLVTSIIGLVIGVISLILAVFLIYSI